MRPTPAGRGRPRPAWQAILLNKLELVAVVGGNEVTNPFVVTEVYVADDHRWALASMSFTRLLAP